MQSLRRNGVRVAGVPEGVKGAHAVEVGLVRRQTGAGVVADVWADDGDLGPGAAVGGAFDLEAVFVG